MNTAWPTVSEIQKLTTIQRQKYLWPKRRSKYKNSTRAYNKEPICMYKATAILQAESVHRRECEGEMRPPKKKTHKRVSSTHPGNFVNGKDRNGGRGICYRIWSYIPNEIASSPVWIYKCKWEACILLPCCRCYLLHLHFPQLQATYIPTPSSSLGTKSENQ